MPVGERIKAGADYVKVSGTTHHMSAVFLADPHYCSGESQGNDFKRRERCRQGKLSPELTAPLTTSRACWYSKEQAKGNV
jgi:hypothetical protein